MVMVGNHRLQVAGFGVRFAQKNVFCCVSPTGVEIRSAVILAPVFPLRLIQEDKFIVNLRFPGHFYFLPFFQILR